MSRSTYSCGGAGKHGNPPKACTVCGRHHPKGKKQKKKATDGGWLSCKAYRNRATRDESTAGPATIHDPELLKRRQAKNIAKRERNAAIREANLEKMNKRVKRSPAEQLKILDERLGKGIGAKKERKRLKNLMK